MTISRRGWIGGILATLVPGTAWAAKRKKGKHRMKPRIDIGFHFATETDAQAALTKLNAALVGRNIYDQPIIPYVFWDAELQVWVVLSDTRFNALADWTLAKSACEGAMLLDGTRDKYLPGSYVISFMSFQDQGGGGADDLAEMTRIVK